MQSKCATQKQNHYAGAPTNYIDRRGAMFVGDYHDPLFIVLDKAQNVHPPDGNENSITLLKYLYKWL